MNNNKRHFLHKTGPANRETNKNQLLENMNCMFYINLKAE